MTVRELITRLSNLEPEFLELEVFVDHSHCEYGPGDISLIAHHCTTIFEPESYILLTDNRQSFDRSLYEAPL